MFNQKFYYDFGFNNINYYMGLVSFMNYWNPLSVICQALACIQIRKGEYQADQFAVQKKRGKELISGLSKLI